MDGESFAGLPPGPRHGAFEKVIALNEGSKELLARSASVNLLALDAMVQSKHAGGNLRGFDEVSSQMRSWSQELHQQLLGLSQACQELVVAASYASRDARVLRALELSRVGKHGERLDQALEQQQQRVAARRTHIRQLQRRAADVIADLNQLGMMAVVLSRAAMIEAASGTDEQRVKLGEVSQEFYRHSEAVGERLAKLRHAAHED